MVEGKDYEIIDGHLKIFEGVTIIPSNRFSFQNITSVEMPDTVRVVEAHAFEFCDIKIIKFSKNLKEIHDSAFSVNPLESVILPESLIHIGEYAFSNNRLGLDACTFSKNIEYIGDNAFENNYLSQVTLPESLKFIGKNAFAYNNLTSINIPSSVQVIKKGAFKDNKLTQVNIENGVEEIEDCAFLNNSLTNLELPKSITFIGADAFTGNKLTSIDIPSNVKTIGTNAFASNDLTSVVIENGVTVICSGAFYDNKLTSVKIPESVTSIELNAFADNNLTCIELPRSVVEIKNNGLGFVDVIYDGILIKKELLQRYGYDNLIKIYEILKIITEEKLIEIPPDLIGVIPATEESIKGYIANKKIFSFLTDTIICEYNEYQDIFKLCFVLGIFNKPEKEVVEFISNILQDNDLDYIHQMWTAVKLTTYKPKFKELFMKLYEEGKTDYNGNNIIGRLYTSFEKINKFTIKRHEDIISKKNTEIKRLKELGANTTLLEQELDILKTNKKNISYEDIVYYIKNNTFDIRDGNEDLKDIVDTLAVHIEQEGFDEIQDIYEESISIEKTIPLTNDMSGKDIKYHWSKSDNPINTILGYLVNCCAKLGGAGEDIMRQSMINPDIANLIIYDENNQVMGKATAYYNRKGKYILFNNAEIKGITSRGLKSATQREKECLEALIRGTMDAVNVLKEKGEDIKEVRIGMLRNDLANVIEEYGLEISYELLQSYNWKDYAGDASDTARGQAIIYKDSEFDKNKNI